MMMAAKLAVVETFAMELYEVNSTPVCLFSSVASKSSISHVLYKKIIANFHVYTNRLHCFCRASAVTAWA
jgi:hypothetical protein